MGRVYHSGSTIAKSKLIKLVIASQIKNREMASMPGMLDALIILLMRHIFSILGYDGVKPFKFRYYGVENRLLAIL